MEVAVEDMDGVVRDDNGGSDADDVDDDVPRFLMGCHSHRR